MPLHMKVAQATFAKKIMFGSKKASSFELVYNRVFPIEGFTAALPENLKESFTKCLSRRKIGSAWKARARKFDNFKENQYLYFYQEQFGCFVGPAKVIHVMKDGYTKVLYKGRKFSVSKDMAEATHQLLEYWIGEQDSVEEAEVSNSYESHNEKNDTVESNEIVTEER